MKTLIIVSHPTIETSVINKRWIQELEKFPDKYDIHQLYQVYPDGKINVQKEQYRIEQYDKIIFQFPLYWYSSPPLLKQWFDQVLTYGWAYGSKSGYKMGGKKIALAISAGVAQHEFSPAGKHKYTISELTRPFELTASYIKANYLSPFAYYDLESNSSKQWIEDSVPKYLDYIDQL